MTSAEIVAAKRLCDALDGAVQARELSPPVFMALLGRVSALGKAPFELTLGELFRMTVDATHDYTLAMSGDSGGGCNGLVEKG